MSETAAYCTVREVGQKHIPNITKTGVKQAVVCDNLS